MTIEDLVEEFVTLQGNVEVRVYSNGGCETVFDGDGDDVQREGCDEDWYNMYPLTFIYPSDSVAHPADKGFVLEVDGEEER